jgi:PAS domain S-box-containing protein
MLALEMTDLKYDPVRGLPKDSGWPALFWEAFRRSRNPMMLLDANRVHVDVNAAYLNLLGYQRRELLGQPFYKLVVGGPVLTNAEWQEMLKRKQFSATAELVCKDCTHVKVEFAAHPEVVTGRRLVLGVALRTARGLRRLDQRPAATRSEPRVTERELDVIALIALGLSGPEIAEEMHLAHHTVRTHTRNAMGKLGARSRAQLVAMSVATGMLRFPVSA